MIRFLSNKFLLIGSALLLSVAGFVYVTGSKHDDALPRYVDFNYDVRPILVQKCYLCHGPDPGSRKGDLRLDTYEGATSLTKEGLKAIDPEHAEKSLVLIRINHKDPDIVMPTPESNLTLTERERKLIAKWIEQGATYKQHWAFIPEKADPQISGYKGNPVDFFISRKLDEAGLSASGKADKNSLVRRVAYLLTGLPPAEKDRLAFLADNSDKAYEKMVDHYLQSPRFGETWARHWMDVVRYAETRGHEFDFTISGAWRYRDYLVRAFNEDLPYNQFVMEHLAGDLLTEPRINKTDSGSESRLATMFYVFTEGKHSPVDVRKDEAERIDNMIDVSSKAFLGLTLSCARCHDHKFDPLSAKDYYSFYGVMEGTRFTPVAANRPLHSPQVQELAAIKDSVRTAVWSYLRKRTQSQQAGSASFASVAKKAKEPAATAYNSSRKVLADFSGFDLQGWQTEGEAFTRSTTLGEPRFSPQHTVTGLQEGLASSRKLATGIFGALRSPDFTIQQDFIGVMAAGNQASIRIIVDNFQLISYPIYQNIDQKVNTDKLTPFVFDVSQWKGHKAYIEALTGSYSNHVFSMSRDAFIEVKYAIAYNGNWFDPTQAAGKKRTTGLAESVLKLREGKASGADMAAINAILRNGNMVAKSPLLLQRLDKAEKLSASFTDTLLFYSGVTDGFGKNSKVFIRGNPEELSPEPVKRIFLPAVAVSKPSLDVAGSGRMQLANSITDASNPLTSRVMVNRIWHHLFGRGIVETTDNFGLQGKLPSHPELLDYLALQFRKDGYSIKTTIRRILLSETFQRSTERNSKAKAKDPANVFLSHYPLRRLEAEAIRDAMLLVSASLDSTMYGPPVPTYITSFMNGRGKPAETGVLDGRGRRSVYLEVRRNFPDPMMVAFDRPAPFTSFGRRAVTNVPSQSLILLNDPFVVEMADRTAVKLLAQKLAGNEENIHWLYSRCFSRSATKKEISEAIGFLAELRATYAKRRQPVNDRIIWKDYVHTLFNLKEFIFLN